MARRIQIALATATLLLGGCFVVDDTHLNSLNGDDAGPNGNDGGDDDAGGGDTDAGPEQLLHPMCGQDESEYFVIRDTTEGLVLDTRGMPNTVSERCGVSDTGPNGFLALEVTGGQQWHFHVTAGSSDLDPLIYLLDSNCDSRNCEFNSNYCVGQNGEEHFAFIAPTDGIFYLGIDDGSNSEGGVYNLSAYLLRCDGMEIHGEACDGMGNCHPTRCQAQLSESTVASEVEVNDSQVEANLVVLPASNTFEFSGSLTPGGCTYPDVYAFDVDSDGSTVEILALDASGVQCIASSLTEDFTLTLRNSSNEVVVAPMQETGTGCAIIEPRSLDSGTYYLWVDYVAPLEDRPVGYNLRLSVTP